MRCMFSWVIVVWGIFHFFAFKSSSVVSVVCFGAFGWIWADNISQYTSEFILLLLSLVISSINTGDPAWPNLCFTDDVVWLDHELFLPFATIFSFHHFAAWCSSFHQSKNYFPKLDRLFLAISVQVFFLCFFSWGYPMVCTL